VIISLRRRGMVRAVEGKTPFLCVTTIAAPAGLLGNEKADIVVDMVGRVKASCTHHAAIVQCTIPE
jgi:hypothetical protein